MLQWLKNLLFLSFYTHVSLSTGYTPRSGIAEWKIHICPFDKQCSLILCRSCDTLQLCQQCVSACFPTLTTVLSEFVLCQPDMWDCLCIYVCVYDLYSIHFSIFLRTSYISFPVNWSYPLLSLLLNYWSFFITDL